MHIFTIKYHCWLEKKAKLPTTTALTLMCFFAGHAFQDFWSVLYLCTFSSELLVLAYTLHCNQNQWLLSFSISTIYYCPLNFVSHQKSYSFLPASLAVLIPFRQNVRECPLERMEKTCWETSHTKECGVESGQTEWTWSAQKNQIEFKNDNVII